jgi:hypothetical protein
MPSVIPRSFAVAALALLVVAPRVAAQDTQYWADGYGTQARMLGGIVIGSDPDISAVYYNPGAIALADSLQFLISLNALRYSSLGFSVPSVPNVPSSTGWSALSNMFAGTVPIGGRDSHERMAYSLLTRQSFGFAAQLREIPLDSFTPVQPPPPTTSVGNALVNQSLTETWAGATYSIEKDKHWGLGASLFIAIRSQSWSQTVSAQVVDGAGATALAEKEYDFSYYNWAALVKLGAEYKEKNWSAGLTLTTPRLGLFGGADVGATQSYIDEGLIGPGSSQIATDYQAKLGASYHSPLSIGAGFAYEWKDTQINFAAEWFSSVARFTIIPAVPFTAQTNDTLVIPMALTAQYRSLVNFGVGLEHKFSDHWKGYAAYRTDKTSIPPGIPSVGTLINWNLQHANLGTQATIGRAAIILGLDMAWGSQDGVQTVGSPPGLPLFPAINESFINITGAIGFNFKF